MNKLYFYGHNCFVAESAAALLIIDPWLTPQGAFFGSWHQFPDNTHLRQPLVEKTADKDTYVYLTHEHRDHFDPETLSMLAAAPRFRGFFIPAFHDPYLREQLEAYGKSVTEVADTHKQAVTDDIGIQVFVSDVGVNHDSAVLVTTPDFTLLNQNDCKIFDRLQTIELPRINYYSVQFSGATWHPVCFRMPDEDKRRISEKKLPSSSTMCWAPSAFCGRISTCLRPGLQCSLFSTRSSAPSPAASLRTSSSWSIS